MNKSDFRRFFRIVAPTTRNTARKANENKSIQNVCMEYGIQKNAQVRLVKFDVKKAEQTIGNGIVVSRMRARRYTITCKGSI